MEKSCNSIAKHLLADWDYAFILCAYYPYDSIMAYSFCCEIMDKLQQKGLSSVGIIVSNKSGIPSKKTRQGQWFAIDGSNKMAEFSAYQEGLAFLLSHGGYSNNSRIAFVNDTIVTHRNFAHGSSVAIAEQLVMSANGIIGFSESGGWRNFSIDGTCLTRWISTFFFALSVEELAKLNFLICDLNDYKLFMLEGIEVKFSPSISAPLQHHILSWLTTPGNWYAARPINKWNKKLLRLKIACILSEKLLTTRCIIQCIQIRALPQHLFSYN